MNGARSDSGRQGWNNVSVRLGALLLVAVHFATTATAQPPELIKTAPTPEKLPAPIDPAPEKKAPASRSLADARSAAQKRSAPIVAVVITDDCPACDRLLATLAAPDLDKALKRWVLAVIDAARNPADARALRVESAPTLVVLTPAGRLIASRDRDLNPPDLVKWLSAQFAAAEPRPVAGDDAPLDDAAVQRLVKDFAARDPAVREAAVRRLTPAPKLAAEAVVAAYAGGPLQAKLAAFELLQTWAAPLEGNGDPWEPKNLTPVRIDALRAWARAPDVPAPKALTPESLAQVCEELDRLVLADDVDAPAIRERLVRFGNHLKSELDSRLGGTPTDQTRQRLTALRYRLAASHALALAWPDGFDRLASGRQPVRQQAVKELENRVSPRDEPLLLELFGSPDPYLREISLRILHRNSTKTVSESLIKLLYDPDPNVRSAVLKQMLDVPNPAAIEKLEKYIAWETEVDLVVNAVRALREIGTKESTDKLAGLLGHAHWQVRAEAVDGIGKALKYQNDAWSTDLRKKSAKLLEDPEGYVVGKALGVVGDQVTPEELGKLARRLPDLAPSVVRMMGQMRGKDNYYGHGAAPAIAELKKFAADKRDDVRAAAVTSLTWLAPLSTDANQLEAELTAALKDPAPPVRLAAMSAIYQHFWYQRSNASNSGGGRGSGDVFEDPAFAPQGLVPAPPKKSLLDNILGLFQKGPKKDPDTPEWATAMRKGAPPWILKSRPIFAAALKSTDAGERFVAAALEMALGDAEAAPAVAAEAIEKDSSHMQQAAQLIGWLPRSKQLGFFESLHARSHTIDGTLTLLDIAGGEKLAVQAHVWKLAESGALKGEHGNAFIQAVRSVYQFPDPNQSRHRRTYNPDPNKPVAPPAEVKERFKTFLESGSDDIKIIMLGLLTVISSDEALAAARAAFADPAVAPAYRRDMAQIEILLAPHAEGTKRAVELLSDRDPAVRRLALEKIGSDFSQFPFGLVRQTYFNVNQQQHYSSYRDVTFPRLPAKLDLAALRRFLTDDQPDSVALAAFLLVAAEDPDGWEPLYRVYKAHPDDWNTIKLVYTAIAILGDDSKTPILEEIAGRIAKDNTYIYRPFYWTIRVIDGPNVLNLRKRIRQDVGMKNLL